MSAGKVKKYGAEHAFLLVASLVSLISSVYTIVVFDNKTIKLVSITVIITFSIILMVKFVIPRLLTEFRSKYVLPSDFEVDKMMMRFSIEQANRADINWIADLEARYYSVDDAIPEKILHEWFEANNQGFFVFKSSSRTRVGHLDILPIKKSTLSRFIKGEILERDIRGDSIYSPSERSEITDLYVESIIICPKEAHARFSIMMTLFGNISSLINRIADIDNLDKIYAIAATEAGKKFMKRLGFHTLCDANQRSDNHVLFCASVKELVQNVANVHSEKPELNGISTTISGGL